MPPSSSDEFRFYVHGGTNYALYKEDVMLQVKSVKPHYKLGADGHLYRDGVFAGPVRNGQYKIDMPQDDARSLWRYLYSEGYFALPEGWGGQINPPKIRI